jgi:hypothetical protein
MSLVDGPVAYDQRLVRTGDGALVLTTDSAALLVREDLLSMTVDAPSESLVRQLVTTYGLPLLLRRAPAVILHASAAVPPDGSGAIVVCGRSGSGKSSILVGLIDRGWRAVSEDVCTIDLRGDGVVWPGPPWVRRAGEGPVGSLPLFRTVDKTAWDLAPWQVTEAVPVGRFVFLEPAGGEAPVFEPVARSEAIARLVRATISLASPVDRAISSFAACARLGTRIEAWHLRLPRSDDWVERAAALLVPTS